MLRHKLLLTQLNISFVKISRQNVLYCCLILMFPELASAQPSGCVVVGIETLCPGPDLDPSQSIAFELKVRQAIQRQQARERQQQIQIDATNRAALEERNRADAKLAEEDGMRRAIGKLIADGQCDAAYNFALSNGKFDIAKEIKELCK